MNKRLLTLHENEEGAQLWDKHDFTDYLADLEEDTEAVSVRPESGVLELRGSTWSRLVREAKRRRTNPPTLVRRWLEEKLSAGESQAPIPPTKPSSGFVA